MITRIKVIAAMAVVTLSPAIASAEEVVYVVNTYVHNPAPLPDWGTVVMCRAGDLEVLDVLTVGDNAHSAVVSPDGAQLWVTCDTGNGIYGNRHGPL